MQRLVTQADLGIVMDCIIDVNPYCQVIKRGYNISCEECKRRHLWEKFWRQDQKWETKK